MSSKPAPDGVHLTFKVDKILGVDKAHLDLPGGFNTAIFYGPNVSGKSSLAKALGAALSSYKQGNFLGLPATRRMLYAHNGTSGAKVDVVLATGAPGETTTLYHAVWEPTKGFSLDVGTPCIPALVGMEDMLDWGAKEYTQLFQGQKLEWAPFVEAFAKGLGLVGSVKMMEVHFDLARKVYDLVNSVGIAAAHEQYRVHAVEAKRDWEHAVASAGEHEKYGKRKAAEWRPTGWVPELDATARETIEQQIAMAEAELEEVKRQTHYDEAAIKHLHEVAGCHDEYKKRHDLLVVTHKRDRERVAMLRNKLTEKIAEVDKAAGEYRAAKARCAPDAPPDFNCPHCGGKLNLAPVNGNPGHYTVEQYKEPAKRDMAALEKDAELAKRVHDRLADEMKRAREDVASCQRGIDKMQGEAGEAGNLLQQAIDAREQLKQVPAATAQPADTERMKSTVAHLRRQLTLVDAVSKAETARLAVARYEQIMDALKPQGPVDTALSNIGVAAIKRMFDTISKKLGQDDLTINDFTVEVGGRPVQLCSENERFMARLAIMTAVALVLKQPVVVVDRLDVAVSPERREALKRFITEWKPTKTKLLFMLAATSREDATYFGCDAAFKLANGSLTLDP